MKQRQKIQNLPILPSKTTASNQTTTKTTQRTQTAIDNVLIPLQKSQTLPTMGKRTLPTQHTSRRNRHLQPEPSNSLHPHTPKTRPENTTKNRTTCNKRIQKTLLQTYNLLQSQPNTIRHTITKSHLPYSHNPNTRTSTKNTQHVNMEIHNSLHYHGRNRQ